MTTAISPKPVLDGLDKAIEVHRSLRARLAAVDDAIEALPDTTPRLLAPWSHFVRGMNAHMQQEEELVFPAVRALALGQTPVEGFEAPLLEMQYEIDEVRILGDALRNAAPDAGPVEPMLLELLDALEEHARMEEERLFPVAVALLEEWDSDTAATEEPVEEVAADPLAPVDVGTLLTERRGHPVEVLSLAETSIEVIEAWAEALHARGAVAIIEISGGELAQVATCSALAATGVDEVLVRLDEQTETVKDSLEALGRVQLPCSVLLPVGRDDSERIATWYHLLLQPHFEHVRECFVHGADGQGPDELLKLLASTLEGLEADDVHRFTKLLATLREAFSSERPLDGYRYVVSRSHYGTSEPAGRWLDLPGLSKACANYRQRASRHPDLARARLLVELARSMGRNQVRVVMDLVRLQLQYTAGERRTPLAGKYLYLVVG